MAPAMSRIVFDQPPWWHRPGWQAAIAATLAVVAWAIWWTALTPVDHDPIVARTLPAPTVMARSAPPAPLVPLAPVTPVAPAARTAPPMTAAPAMPDDTPAPATPAWSATGSPGTRATPLSAPPGLLAPAESPTEDNLEN